MRAQFFIISSVIMIYVIVLTFQYLTGFSDIKITRVEEQQEIYYIQKIKDSFIQTFNVSNYSSSGDFNKIVRDISFTRNFFKNELLKSGINFDGKFLLFSNGFETGLSKWTISSGELDIDNEIRYDGLSSLHCDSVENANKTLPGIYEVYARLYVNFKKLPSTGSTHYFMSFYDENNNQIFKLGLVNNGGNNFGLRAYSDALVRDFSSQIYINSEEWHYFELYWYENSTGSRMKAWYDGSLKINETVDSQSKGKSINKYIIGLIDGSPPRNLYIDCVAVSNEYIGKDCYPDAENYYVFSLKTDEIDAKTGFTYFYTPPGSTTLQLTPPTYDVYWSGGSQDANFEPRVNFDTSSIPSGKIIDDAKFCMYITESSNMDNDVRVMRYDGGSWVDLSTDRTWSSLTFYTWSCIDVTTQVQGSYNEGETTLQLRLQDPDGYESNPPYESGESGLFFGKCLYSGCWVYMAGEDSENMYGTGNVPYLSVTYSDA